DREFRSSAWIKPKSVQDEIVEPRVLHQVADGADLANIRFVESGLRILKTLLGGRSVGGERVDDAVELILRLNGISASRAVGFEIERSRQLFIGRVAVLICNAVGIGKVAGQNAT